MYDPSQNDSDRQKNLQDTVPDVPLKALRQLKQLSALLANLPKECTGRDRPDNRTLSYANYAGLVLMSLFSPAINSLRDIQRASEFRRVRKALTPVGSEPAKRTSMGSLSESVRVFDPELLRPLMDELAAKLPKTYRPKPAYEVPDEVLQKLVAVDGSCLQALAQIVAAHFSGGPKAKPGQVGWRLHLQFRVAQELPEVLELTGENTGIEADERTVLARHLEPDCVYVADRGYEKYSLFNAIVQAGSDYVIRVQRRPVEVVQQQLIDEAAKTAGVLSDEIITAGGSQKESPAVDHPLRRIIIEGGVPQGPPRTGKQQPRREEIVLLTNLVDVPAEVIAAIYRLRWRIEVFFRFFKHLLGVRRLLSTKDEGVLIQVYCSIIAALLMALATGQSLSRATMQALEMYFSGWAEEDEVQAALAKEAKRQASQQAKKSS